MKHRFRHLRRVPQISDLRLQASGLYGLFMLFFAQSAHAQLAPKPITLLEPLPGGIAFIPVSLTSPFGMINIYLNPMVTWGIGIAAGLAILMIIVGGLQMMLSGGSPEGMGSGKQRIISAIFGLIFLVFSAAILNFLNAYYYRLVP